MAKSEIGRELKTAELKPGTVVIIRPPGRPDVALTLWVQAVDPETVVFWAGEIGVNVINFIQPDGSLRDDRGGQVRVYEYLGEV